MLRFIEKHSGGKFHVPTNVKDEFESTIRTITRVWLVKKYGENIYHSPKKVVQSLCLADCDLPSSMLKLPFKAFFISFEEGAYENFGGSVCEGAYFTSKEKDGEEYIQVDYIYTNHYGESMSVATLLYPHAKDLSIKESIVSRMPNCHIIGEDNIDIYSISILAANFILYLNGSKPDLLPVLPYEIRNEIRSIRNPTKRKEAEEKNPDPSDKRVVIIGNSMPELNIKCTAGSKEFSEITYKYWVRGHFRMQWYGSHESPEREQRLIFIEPFLKGNLDGELKVTNYIIAEHR
jgi:hypothetical protein